DPYAETRLLENTLMKLAGLLQVGFGEAGAKIIRKNMHGACLEAMVPGHRVVALFGFADIRSFGLVTEALQEQVMVFVNTVAQIVHENCVKFEGYPNKNIGNAFVIVWKFPEIKEEKQKSEE